VWAYDEREDEAKAKVPNSLSFSLFDLFFVLLMPDAFECWPVRPISACKSSDQVSLYSVICLAEPFFCICSVDHDVTTFTRISIEQINLIAISSTLVLKRSKSHALFLFPHFVDALLSFWMSLPVSTHLSEHFLPPS
jgi:hypothetical protein